MVPGAKPRQSMGPLLEEEDCTPLDWDSSLRCNGFGADRVFQDPRARLASAITRGAPVVAVVEIAMTGVASMWASKKRRVVVLLTDRRGRLPCARV
jgi:hypothetical protein